MAAKTYLRLLQAGLIISLFFVLFVFGQLVFPYITSKQLPFNILMEVLLVFWFIFILKYPVYRPKINLVTYGLLAYFLVILISSFTGVDFNLSFWGDVERMLGFFHLFHFFIFYLILITVFRRWSDWRALLGTSVLVAVIVSLIGLFGKHPHSTIGNTAYVSGYLIFNLFFAFVLFIREKNNWRYFYFLPILIMLIQFAKMKTSGAIIGLFGGIFITLLLLAVLHVKRQVKIKLSVLIFASLVAVIFLFSQQDASWFQNSFLRNLTSQKTTFQTRLLSWQGAWQEFGNHPWLGTGFGNYAIIFDRQFNPKFFDYDQVETYFDRAHNNLIDIASTTGLLGLFSYLSIFIFVIIYLFKQLKRNDFKINSTNKGQKNLEIIVIFGLLTAYFIQNLAVFDSFVTYVGLMIILGFIVWLRYEEELSENLSASAYVPAASFRGSKEGWSLLILLIITWLFISQYNLKPWRMLTGVIEGYKQVLTGKTIDGLETFRNSLIGTPLDRDGRSTLINLAISNPILFTALPPERMQAEYDYVLELANKNLAYNEQDSLFLLQLSQLYDLGSRIFADDPIKKDFYADKTLELSERAISASPGRIPVYITKSQALLMKNDLMAAINVLEYAANLNVNYANTFCRLGQLYILNNQNDEAANAFNVCIDNGATEKLGAPAALAATASFLLERGDYERAVIVAEELVKSYDEDPEVWLNLAKLYLTVNKEDKAREAGQKVILLNPDYASQVEALFNLDL